MDATRITDMIQINICSCQRWIPTYLCCCQWDR